MSIAALPGASISTICGAPVDSKAMLEVIDQLRQEIVDGKIVAFAAIGINAVDETYGYTACSKRTTRLQVMGAIAQLQYSYMAGDL